MKVLCVKEPQKTNNPSIINSPHPKVGDIDPVVDEVELNGVVYYILARFGYNLGFNANCFATLPDKSDEQMKEEEKEGIINLEKSFV